MGRKATVFGGTGFLGRRVVQHLLDHGFEVKAASRHPERGSPIFIRSRGEGEAGVRGAFSEATIIRPAVMFGPDDAFLIPLMKMLRTFPVFPMFGRGQIALQPSYVEDVAEAIARSFDARKAGNEQVAAELNIDSQTL